MSQTKIPAKSLGNKLDKLNVIEKEQTQAMKAELNYFKGVSVIVTMLLFCIFFVFSALFSAMYMETKMTREAFVALYGQITDQTTEISTPAE